MTVKDANGQFVSTGANSTYKKLAVEWLHEALCFISSSVVADSFVLRHRQLLVAAERWVQCDKNSCSPFAGQASKRAATFQALKQNY
jgi:hypothetical protein